MRLAVLEPQRAVQREHGGRPAAAVVVRGEQLEDSAKGQEVVRIQSKEERTSHEKGHSQEEKDQLISTLVKDRRRHCEHDICSDIGYNDGHILVKL